ncbi:MAG: hypothetical protein ABIK67_07640 [candidate division WOR-3 bacterium]
MRCEVGIEIPSKAETEIDFERLKKQIKDKVASLLAKDRVADNQINSPNFEF